MKTKKKKREEEFRPVSGRVGEVFEQHYRRRLSNGAIERCAPLDDHASLLPRRILDERHRELRAMIRRGKHPVEPHVGAKQRRKLAAIEGR